MAYQAPRGTYDRLPDESKKWEFIVQTFKRIVEGYGYGELVTPIIEDTELFVRSSGETSDVVSKEMYTFFDRSERSLTLKPEGTAGVVRSFIQHKIGAQGGVHRFWYMTPIFRYDRPQKGRCRQGHQVGLELMGTDSIYSDAEVISITSDFYKALGIKDLTIQMNSIGCLQTRKTYCEALLEHLQSYLISLDDHLQQKIKKNPLRLFDSKDQVVQDKLSTAPSILDFLSVESLSRFKKLEKILSKQGIPFCINSSLVRGLDYYNETVFEVVANNIGAQSSLCGGGRYDSLVKELGGPATPSCGVAMGIERALMVIPDFSEHLDWLDVYFVAATKSAEDTVVELCRKHRDKGVKCNFDLDFKSIKHQMKQADKMGAKEVVIIGDDELEKNIVTIKNMKTGEQRTLLMDEFLSLEMKE